MSVVTINDVYHFLRKVRKFSECRTSFGKVRFNSDCKLRNLSKDLLISMYELYLHCEEIFSSFAFTVCPLVSNYVLIYVEHGMHTELINCTNVEREQTGSLFYSLHCTNFYGKWANVYVYE